MIAFTVHPSAHIVKGRLTVLAMINPVYNPVPSPGRADYRLEMKRIIKSPGRRSPGVARRINNSPMAIIDGGPANAVAACRPGANPKEKL